MPDNERFWGKVQKSDGCWLWMAGKHQSGYGVVVLAERKQVRAHRASWEFSYGPIPAGLYVCHRCDNPACVRPDHLFLGTQLDNMQDMHEKKRDRHSVHGLKTHCKHGHEFTPENTMSLPSQARVCRQCSRARSREWERQKARERRISQ